MKENRTETGDGLQIPFQSAGKENRTDGSVVRPFSHLGRMPGPAWFGVISALLLAAGLFIYNLRIYVYGRELPVLNDVQPEFEGYDGIGVPREGFHPEQSAVDALLLAAEDRNLPEEDRENLRTLAESISCSFTKAEGLSNNETVEYACSFDPEAAARAHYNLTELSRTYTVHSLQSYTMLNPFLGVTAYWSTDQGVPEVELQIPQEYLDLGIRYDYTFIDDANISITIDADMQALQERGIMLSFDSMEYPVSNKPELILDTRELSDEEKQELRGIIEAMVTAELDRCGWQASFLGSPLTITGISDIYASPQMFSSHSSLTDIKVSLTTEYEGWMSRFTAFSMSYTGYLYRMADGSMQFRTEDTHACSFSGVFGEYVLAKEN